MSRDRLVVPVAEIPQDGLDLRVGLADLAFAGILAAASEGEGSPSGEAQLRVVCWPQRVDVTGSLSVSIPMLCVRCLASFQARIEREFSQVLVRLPEQQDDEEAELTNADLDRSELAGDSIDLAALLSEEMQLALPLKPLCKDACKGICPGCGAELNVEECTCPPAVDPRWQALKGLKLGS